ncbi:alpha/beta hydrolase [Phenylobacterium sp. LH3H17]|uniref:alpha/beta fold hydrolase n=1 Tax=Phenylobacterium sp. LH3H17 TaxID=2903901 RepID=UPI0020C98951|nr:alpha/beta hydrolase [Phenylobacterium sp. LH3H17]UTP37803.1 alpha/beta hydrolase [Phenylobacterium sp. LH3H17]
MIKLLLVGLGVLLALWIGAGFAVVAAAGPFKPDGIFVDIGGRKLRLVCKGPKSALPVVWMEAGAWGLAADFAAVQQKLAARGLRSCAYDRAGLGFSDPGPKPRDSAAIVADLEKLVAASGERGPFILMGHSMGGQHVRLFAGRNRDKVAGLVLLEATTPEMTSDPRAERFLSRVRTVGRITAVAGSLGMIRIAYGFGDRIGLPPQGAAEKKHAFVSGRHTRTAADEVLAWTQGSIQAGAVSLDPTWPVAVVTAGDATRMAEWNIARRAPERASRAGWYENVPDAEHATLLGLTHADAVVRAVDHVLKAMPRPVLETP